MLETWTFPDGVLGHTEIIIITLDAYVPRVLFNGYANFTEGCLHAYISAIPQLFLGFDEFGNNRGLAVFKTGSTFSIHLVISEKSGLKNCSLCDLTRLLPIFSSL